MTSLQPIAKYPLIAIARGVEDESRWWFRLDLKLRVLSFSLALVVLILGTLKLLDDRAAVAAAMIAIGLEIILQFFVEKRAHDLQTLARSMLQREIFISAAQTGEDSLSAVALKNQAEQSVGNAAERAVAWIQKRVKMGKKEDGSDFHSTEESDADLRLLDILFENYSWWSELAKAAEARLRIIMVVSAVVTVAAIAAVSTVETTSVRIPLVLILLQTMLLFGALRVTQDWRDWSSAATDFESRRTELSRIYDIDHLEEGELYGFAIDYSVLTRSVTPISDKLLKSKYQKIDDRIQAELRQREKRRLGPDGLNQSNQSTPSDSSSDSGTDNSGSGNSGSGDSGSGNSGSGYR